MIVRRLFACFWGKKFGDEKMNNLLEHPWITNLFAQYFSHNGWAKAFGVLLFFFILEELYEKVVFANLKKITDDTDTCTCQQKLDTTSIILT